MGCNCGKNRLAPGQEWAVILTDGTEHLGFTSEAQAKVAAAKLGGGVVKAVTKA